MGEFEQASIFGIKIYSRQGLVVFVQKAHKKAFLQACYSLSCSVLLCGRQ